MDKLRGAIRVTRTSGLRGLWQATRRNLTGLPTSRKHVDEVDLVRRCFDTSGRHSGLMIDVGAHHGGACLGFARMGWNVLAFEPDVHNRAELAAAVRAFPKIRLDERAVSNCSAPAVAFYRSEQSSGISGLSAFHSSHVAAGAVETTTLTAVIAELSIGAIDLLKIDTEGFDKLVLDGLPWETHAPAVIICEFEDRKTLPLGYGFHDLGKLLADRGYSIVVSEWEPIVQYGGSHRWLRFHPYPCELTSITAWGNFIAIRDADFYARVIEACRRIQRHLS